MGDKETEPVEPGILSGRFSTRGAADSNGIELWRSQFGHAICRLDIEPLSDREFGAEAVLRGLPGLSLASGSCSGAHYWQPNNLISNDDFIFIINRSGVDLAKQRGRESIVGSGEAVLLTAAETGGVTNKANARFTTIRLPHGALAPALNDSNRAIMTPIRADNEALRLLLNYVSVLENAGRLATARSRELVVSHIYDLITLAIGANKDAAHVAHRRGLPAARLRAVKSEIAKQIAGGVGDLININAIAARNAVTARYIQTLFESEGTTFSEFVMVQRLAAAYRQLSDAGLLQRRIIDIAFSAGFNDVSYFNRLFRRHFGCSPSDVRPRGKPND